MRPSEWDRATHGLAPTRVASLLLVTAVAEGGTGLALISIPSVVFWLLLGEGQASPEMLLIGRVAGASLLAIGVACWAARGDRGSPTRLGLVAGLLVYNVSVAGLLGYAGMASGIAGLALWPAVLFHTAMSGWCAGSLPYARPTAQPSPGDDLSGGHST
jgi:hypothetical protein